jgi:hypothetical protein
MLIRIDSGYFVAGVVLEGAYVVRAAPIVKYMMGWTKERVVSYSHRKKWKYEICDHT